MSKHKKMAGKELERQLRDEGNQLLNPPFSIDELLTLLHRVEVSLSKVHQSPCGSMLDALSPLRNALVSVKLLSHPDTDVKVSVAFCITEIVRITAPDAPYNDKLMKDIFCLIIDAFRKLSHMSSCSYPKAVSVLVTVAMTRAVVIMLDLDCHALIIEMFQLFLDTVRSNNSEVVSTSMVTIMTVAILESDTVLLDIVTPLLASIRKENQNVSPNSWNLGKEVIENCAPKIKPYLLKAVYSLGVSLDSYDEIVASICHNTDGIENCNSFGAYGSQEHMINDDRPPIQCLDGRISDCRALYRSGGIEENHEKRPVADSQSLCLSFKSYMKQPAAFTKTWSNDFVNIWSCQKRSDESPEMLIPPSQVKIRMSGKGSYVGSGMKYVHGYEVKSTNAPLLIAIFAKYGDIAADCQYTSHSVRASLLEIVCDVVNRLQNTDTPLSLSEIKIIQNEIKDLEATRLKLSWLSEPLAKISEVEKIAQMRSMLKSIKANGTLVIKAATKELQETLMELVAVQKRMREAEKRVNAMKLVVQKIENAIKEAEDEECFWQRQMKELLQC